MKLTNVIFCRGHKHLDEIVFILPTWMCSLKTQLLESSPAFNNLSMLELSQQRNANALDKWRRCRRSSSCIKSLLTPALIATLGNYDGDGTENVKKATGLTSKTTTLHVHAFLYISLLSLLYYDVKWPNFKFIWERERQGDKFYHLCLNSGAVPSLHLQPKFSSFK